MALALDGLLEKYPSGALRTNGITPAASITLQDLPKSPENQDA
jgi:hypothetical protein